MFLSHRNSSFSQLQGAWEGQTKLLRNLMQSCTSPSQQNLGSLGTRVSG